MIASSLSINVEGAITADGGIGRPDNSLGRVSGGGSGGAIHLLAPIISGSGTLQALGGSGDSPSRGGGSSGRIRVDAFTDQFIARSDPPAPLGSPSLALPANPPSLLVVTVGGVPVSPNPMGNFEAPDVQIALAAEATLELEARKRGWGYRSMRRRPDLHMPRRGLTSWDIILCGPGRGLNKSLRPILCPRTKPGRGCGRRFGGTRTSDGIRTCRLSG